jgi:F-type H+-transporting ATPase subunit alpha
MPMEEQALVIFAGTAPENFLMAVPVRDVRRWEKELLEFVRARHSALLAEIKQVADLTKDIREKLVAVCNEFNGVFKASEDKKAK